MKRYARKISVLLFLFFVLFSCKLIDPKEEENPDTTKKGIIETGKNTEVAIKVIYSSGGTIKVDQPTSQVDGLEIEIPANSFSTIQNFKISYSEIKSHQFGQNFNPVSPLITISYDGTYSANPMQIKVPIQLPKGHFAMAFFYDETSGKLEGLPVLSLSSNSITVSTRHFMSGKLLYGTSSLLKSGNATTTATANMIISSIPESVLQSSPIINSGFTPGRDDWEFINYGSYLEPGGHCAGQSITSMWYYYEKKMNNEPDLFHQFDLLNTKTNPSFMWQDNPLGYRFASVIQTDFNFFGWINSLRFQSFLPDIVFKTFAASMLITGEPQFVLIRNSTGNGGHAMIVYKVDFKEGKLYIADPNYPNNRTSKGEESIRVIEYAGGKFKSYETGLIAGAASTTMDQIGYSGKTAYINWAHIGQRWSELKNNTIGSILPNTFPFYTIGLKNRSDYQMVEEIKDGYLINRDTMNVVVSCLNPEVYYNLNNQKLIGAIVFDQQGKRIDVQDESGNPETNNLDPSFYVKLKPGANKLGFNIYGNRRDFKTKEGVYIKQYIDFKWITVNCIPLTIDPNPLKGQPNKELKLTARSKGAAPKSAKYIWDFGDGTTTVSVINDSIVGHTFAKEGKFTIKLELYDNSTNKKLTEIFSVAEIAQNSPIFPKQLSGFLNNLTVNYIDQDKKVLSKTESFSFVTDEIPPSERGTISWSGNTFSFLLSSRKMM